MGFRPVQSVCYSTMTNKETPTEAYKATLVFLKEEEIYEDDTYIETIEEEAFTITVYTKYSPATGLHTLQPFMVIDGEPAEIELDDMLDYDLVTPNPWDIIQTNLAEYLSETDCLPEWHTMSKED